MANKSGYQKFRGNPEVKLLYVLDNFIGGINTEFTDDSSSVADFDNIINFDMDKLGTLHKRQGFGELTALSDIFNLLPQDLIPVVRNRTESNLNPESDNDNVVYMSLLKNDNNCFRNLSGFSSKKGFREYQKRYGFQNNSFTLLLITSNVLNDSPVSSYAWYYKCTLPKYVLQFQVSLDSIYQRNVDYYSIYNTSDTIYQEGKKYFKNIDGLYVEMIENKDYGVGEAISGNLYEHKELIVNEDYNVGSFIDKAVYIVKDNVIIEGYKTKLPVIFNWDRNLLNMDNIEYYNKIYFTNNNKGLVCFNRDFDINSNESLANAFTYSGFSEDGVTNLAFKPSSFEASMYGFNMLAGANPIHYIENNNIATVSIQGMAIFNRNLQPTYDIIPAGQSFKVGIYYTGQVSEFKLTFKDKTNEITYDTQSVVITPDATNSTSGLKVYDVNFLTNPNGEIELKVEVEGSSIAPQYDYFRVDSIEADSPTVSYGLNAGECGLIFMQDRAVLYNRDTIWFSQINDFTYIPSKFYITFPLVSTDKITKISYFKGSYIIFTKYQIWKISGTFSLNSTDFSKELVNESIGCHAGNTVVPIDNTLYFASPRGLYSLKSNQFVEGYENVKELDVKVKTLTSDYTLYAEDREQPAIRYNGINEHAYALRYKDKYILFYNNYNDKGDYAAQNGLDALVYQFDIGSFTTYRFKEKPTFLFMVDNAIEALATVKVKEEFTEEDVLVDYDFTSNISDNKIVDKSGKGNNANIVGSALTNRSVGIKLNGNDSFGTFSDYSGNLKNGFDIQIETKINKLNGAHLIDLQQSSHSSLTFIGSFYSTEYISQSYGYYARLEYTITPNRETKKDTISYRLYYFRDLNVVVPANVGQLSYNIRGTEGIFLENKTASFDVTNGGGLVDSGTFTVNRDANGNYLSTWTLDIASSFVTVTSGVNKGQDVNMSGAFYDTSLNWIKLGFSEFVAKATDTGCTITYNPAVRTTSGLRVGNRSLFVNIDGVDYEHNVYINTYSSDGTVVNNGGRRTINLDYTGSKTINISLRFLANFTQNSTGRYIGTLSTNTTTYSMPDVTPYYDSSVTTYQIRGSGQLEYLGYGNSSYRQIALKINEGVDQLQFILTSEYGNFALYSPAGIGLLERHLWRVFVGPDGYCGLYKDGNLIAQGYMNPNHIINVNRTVNSIGTDRNRTRFLDGEIYGISSNADNVNLLNYVFTEGSGNIANDQSQYRRNLNLNNIDWLVIKGLYLKDSSSFLSIPKLDEDIPFSNGFKIEFEGIINAGPDIVRVVDLAKAYQSETSKIKFNSINVGFRNNLMAFNSTGANGRSYRVEVNDVDTTISHKYVVDCVDNGKGYDISIYIDDVLRASSFFAYGGIANTKRSSNLIGKSNDTTEFGHFRGTLLNMKITIYGNTSGIPIYKSSIYEFDTTPTDFGSPIYVDIKSKGVNLDYPQHIKKLKHVFLKMIGGDEYSQLFFELYCDGHLVNDASKFAYRFSDDGTLILEYVKEENLDINGTLSILGNIMLDKTKLGESTYQTVKMIVPAKGKNFSIRIYGHSEEFLTLDSFGLVCKLGKVKQG